MKKLKILQEEGIKFLNGCYDFGAQMKSKIDFVVRSTLYVYSVWVALLFLLSSNESKVEFAEVWSETSVYLLPLTTFVALFMTFLVVIPIFPRLMNSKEGKVFTFFLIFCLVSYVFLKAIFAVL